MWSVILLEEIAQNIGLKILRNFFLNFADKQTAELRLSPDNGKNKQQKIV
jgi:hypothetical protein